MTLIQITVFAGLALPFNWWLPAALRPWWLFAGCLAGIAWMMGFQAEDLTLLALTLLLIGLVWWAIHPAPQGSREAQIALLIAGAGLGALWLAAQGAEAFYVPVVGVGVTGAVIASLSGTAAADRAAFQRRLSLTLILVVIAILAAVKYPPAARFLSHALTDRTLSIDSASPFVWLGFSYVAFRLIGTLLDFRAGRLPVEGFALRDFTVYVLFFPTFTAGPIDRAQRFITELNQTRPFTSARLVEGGTRILVGIFKKFVIADTLALVTLRPDLVERTDGAFGLWLLLYLYAFQIFFDFSGYSDVAIGLGRLYGITLPENFDRPYLQPNIQQFWQRWHMTLSTWFRVYFFTPLSRRLIQNRFKLPQSAIIFIVQMSTMALIGLWHGVTVNFLLWGLWHGAGLFAFRLIADHTHGWQRWISARPWLKVVSYTANVLVTFHFVALGWVFFALPDTADSWAMLRGLFGQGR